mgnify:CR=1 FL=1
MNNERKSLSARQYLGQLEVIDTKVQQKLEELETLMIGACGINGIDYSKDRVQTSSAGDTVGNAVTRYVSLNEEINAEIDEFADIKHKVIKEIQSLNNSNYIKVLFKVYVQYKSLKATADDMGISYQHVRNIHKKALEEFETMYSDLHYLT